MYPRQATECHERITEARYNGIKIWQIAETALKLLWNISADTELGTFAETLSALSTVLQSHNLLSQVKQAGLCVQNTDADTDRIYKSLRNDSAFPATAIQHIQTAVTLSAAWIL